MKRLLALLLLCRAGIAPAQALTTQDQVSLARAVVQVRGQDPEGRLYFGSGVVIDAGTVVTNCHVVRGGGRLGIFRGASSFPVTRERVDSYHDLCLLEAPGVAQPYARLGQAGRMRPGEALYFLGFPRALGLSVSAGTVRRLHPFGGSKVIETSAFFTLGGSGGGVFDGRGRLVGIATFLAPGHRGAYFAVPADWIAATRQRPAEPVGRLTGASFWEEPVSLPAFLRMPGPP